MLIGKNIAETIAHYAQKQNIDLIVMASHRRTGFKPQVTHELSQEDATILLSRRYK